MHKTNLLLIVLLAACAVPSALAAEGSLPSQPVPPVADGPITAAKGFPSGSGAEELLTVPGAGFSNDGYGAADVYVFWFGEGAIQGTAVGSDGCEMAPLHLPGDAYLWTIWASGVDNDASGDLPVYIYKVDNYYGYVYSIAMMTTSGASSAMQVFGTYTLNFRDIRFPEYSYYAGTCLGNANRKLYGVRVWYSAAMFKDDFESGTTYNWAFTQP